jgi:hypothetical protein
MKCYTSNIKLATHHLDKIISDDKAKSSFVRGIRAALYNIDEWLTDHREIFYDDKQSDLVCKAIGNNIDPRDLNIEQEDQGFFQANANDRLWEKTVLPIRKVLLEIISGYVEQNKDKDRIFDNYIHHLSMGIIGSLIAEKNQCKKQQQQSESGWQYNKNIKNANPIDLKNSKKTSKKPKKSVSWVETVQKIPKEKAGKIPS